MPRIVMALTLVLALAMPQISHAAASLFDFTWTSLASFYTLVFVNRTEPDGSVTLYDEVTLNGSTSGQSLLTLTRPPELGGDYYFEFSGTGGSGYGQATSDGSIPGGYMGFPVPQDVPGGSGSPAYDGGYLEVVGDPNRPSRVSISYVRADSPHCMFNCSVIEFHGSGTRRALSAPEPASVFLVAGGFVAAITLRARRRSQAASAAWAR